MKRKLQILSANQITVDAGIYPRNKWNWNTSYSYMQAMKTGAKFPPITAALLDGKYILVDGRHRFEAKKSLAKEGNLDRKVRVKDKDINIQVEVLTGLTEKEIWVESVKRNIRNGLPFTPLDKLIIIQKLKDFKLGIQKISEIVNMPLANIQRLEVTRMTSSVTGKPVLLKSSLKNLAGVTVKEDFEEETENMNGSPQEKLFDDIITIIENDWVDWNNNTVYEKYETLRKLMKRVGVKK